MNNSRRADRAVLQLAPRDVISQASSDTMRSRSLERYNVTFASVRAFKKERKWRDYESREKKP